MTDKTRDLLAQLDELASPRSAEGVTLPDGTWFGSPARHLQLPKVQVEQARRLITECPMLMERVRKIELGDGLAPFIYVAIDDDTGWFIDSNGEISFETESESLMMASAPKPVPVYTAEAVQEILGDKWEINGTVCVESGDARISVNGNNTLFAGTIYEEGVWPLNDLRRVVSSLEDACKRLTEHGYKIEGWDDDR